MMTIKYFENGRNITIDCGDGKVQMIKLRSEDTPIRTSTEDGIFRILSDGGSLLLQADTQYIFMRMPKIMREEDDLR